MSRVGGGDAFEVHLTTTPITGDALAQYRVVCADLKVKALVIDLGPAMPVQPMTCLRVTGDFQQAWTAAQQLRQQLEAQGFPCTRLKIEAAPWNTGVPDSDEQAFQEPGTRYFEFHARLLLGQETDLAQVQQVCAALGAHLSHNPLKVRADGQHERFVTIRTWGKGRGSVQRQADLLVNRLEAEGWPVTSSVLEYAVYDDHLELDAGWATR
ncbi:hypothetical protein GCM10008957_15780 [Deinococcus ruber]|uniref:Uncharacterized protein n=1 Tax=Deinococcus ruber TaxID=1848197 RepID=A0A918C2D6_9DEIO|nr:hypothetical protein GCM10008957_15780 [Deinococcus ruber]